VPTRYHTLILRTFGQGGYSAGYYAYIKTFDYNVDWMKANGGLTRENSDVSSVGNSVDLNKAFKEFIGHDMEIEPI
jgi:peptidyl-dipeptidase Dcp